MHGAWGVRVHDVQATVDALKVVEAWEAAPAWEGEEKLG
jgi:dihydropteroate synthase